MRLAQRPSARQVGAMLLEQNDEWCLQCRYMQLEGLQSLSDNQPVKQSVVISQVPHRRSCQTPRQLHHHAGTRACRPENAFAVIGPLRREACHRAVGAGLVGWLVAESLTQIGCFYKIKIAICFRFMVDLVGFCLYKNKIIRTLESNQCILAFLRSPSA